METEKIKQLLAEKIPHDKVMAVPILLLMIDTKTWKFPDEFKTNGYAEIAEAIENSDELREVFGS